MIFENPYPFNLIGAPGFRGYYTVHDPDNDRIGFAPTPDKMKDVIRQGNRPTQELTAPLSQTLDIIINTITVIVMGGIGALYYYLIFPELKKTGLDDWVVIIIGLGIIGTLSAVYYFVIYPLLPEWLGEQTPTEEVDSTQLPTPTVKSAMQSNLMPLLLTTAVVGYLLKSVFTPRVAAAATKKTDGDEDVETNNLL